VDETTNDQKARHAKKRSSAVPAELWHVSEQLKEPGDEIAVGRWGARVLESGRNHPSFFREQLLELSRVTWAKEAVSRLACTFAFEDLETAHQHRQAGEFLYSVVPTSWEPSTRVDMLWISFVGVPRAPEVIQEWCIKYWSGTGTNEVGSTAVPMWEWLFAGPLIVKERVVPPLGLE